MTLEYDLYGTVPDLVAHNALTYLLALQATIPALYVRDLKPMAGQPLLHAGPINILVVAQTVVNLRGSPACRTFPTPPGRPPTRPLSKLISITIHWLLSTLVSPQKLNSFP